MKPNNISLYNNYYYKRLENIQHNKISNIFSTANEFFICQDKLNNSYFHKQMDKIDKKIDWLQ